jgi:hypothetical protein
MPSVEKLCVLLSQPGGREFAMKPKVIKRDEGRELAWFGRLLMPGIFNGEHHFEVHPTGDDKSRFVQWEEFTGLLVPMMKKMLNESTKEGFNAMNQAPKREAEAAVNNTAS